MQPLDDDSNLVEPEGVNAASAAQVDEPDRPPAEGDVLGGGDAERPPSEPGSADDRDLTGAPADNEREPGFAHGESGQDSGLMP